MEARSGILRAVDGDELLTIPKVADELKVSHMTVRRYVRAGLLRPVKPGRDYLIPREQVEALQRPKPGRPRTKPA